MTKLACIVQENGALTVTATLIKCGTSPAQPLDVSAATTMEFVLTGEGGVPRITRPATHVTDGIDGKITATIEDNVITPAGNWEVQGIAVFNSLTHPSNVRSFVVAPNL